MKTKILTSIFLSLLLYSCQKSNDKIVKDFIRAANTYNKEKIDRYIKDDFIYISNTDTFSKQDFYNQKDSLKVFEYKNYLISIDVIGNTVKTEERNISIIDSLLDINPKIIIRRSYLLKEGRIVKITIDTVLNHENYNKSYMDKINAFTFYINDTYEIKDQKELLLALKTYLLNYRDLPLAEKKKYLNLSRLQGTFISNDNPYYRKLIFKGKTTVTIIDAILGMNYTTSYVLDENYIRIKTDQSDLLLEIKDNKTLIGEGYASGTFVKKD
ncbi:MAG: hypothetical protein V2I54_02885 [Bacteroidales bacterium]|jgi:hypothetical protein|nr:hypothetical protein [Bacteroidales bacterium]